MSKESGTRKDVGRDRREVVSAEGRRGAVGLSAIAVPPPHPMTAEQDRLEDEDGPFNDGVQ